MGHRTSEWKCAYSDALLQTPGTETIVKLMLPIVQAVAYDLKYLLEIREWLLACLTSLFIDYEA